VAKRLVARLPRAATKLGRAGYNRGLKEEARMSDTQTCAKLGQKVPGFELTTYDPLKDDFGSVTLNDQMARKRWTILFFYPADFTFV
jgi:hypothetical protein